MGSEDAVVPLELLGNSEGYAVYRLYSGDGQLLYVGFTGQLNFRFGDHAKKFWFTQVRGITLEWYVDELDARNAERRAIHVEHPKYNIQHRNGTLQHSSRNPARQTPAPASRILHSLPRDEAARQARQLYQESLQGPGEPISRRRLGAMFGYSGQWGADRIAEAKAEVMHPIGRIE